MTDASRLDLIRDLRERTRRLAASARPEPSADGGGAGLDRLLRGQGFGGGTLVEWENAGEGSGAATLALAVAAHILRPGGALVLIDAAAEFYPPAVAGLGVPLERTVVVRPADPRAGLWAWEQALRCGGVAVTLGRADDWIDRHFHRLQLAAETGGGLGFLLRPAGALGGSSKAAVRLRVAGRPGPGPLHPLARRLRVELLHCRGGAAGATAEVELGHESNPVRVAAELADPAMSAVGA
jgi:protein ImuA